MEKPKVSIIITTCKRKPDMVIRAVQSAANQTYRNVEIFVVDDSPADYQHRAEVRQTIQALEDERIHIIWHEVNSGACVARNTGIRASNGEFIIYLDDDDEFLPELVEKWLKAFTNDRIGLVYGNRFFCQNNDKNNMKLSNFKMVSGNIFKYLARKNFIGAYALVKRECFDKCGLFDEKQLSAQDYEMWLRISSRYEANYIVEPLVIMHLHEGERITTTSYKKIQGTERLCSLYRRYYHKHPYAYHFRHQELCQSYTNSGDKKKAAQHLLQAFFLGPTDIVENLRWLKYLLTHKSPPNKER